MIEISYLGIQSVTSSSVARTDALFELVTGLAEGCGLAKIMENEIVLASNATQRPVMVKFRGTKEEMNGLCKAVAYFLDATTYARRTPSRQLCAKAAMLVGLGLTDARTFWLGVNVITVYELIEAMKLALEEKRSLRSIIKMMNLVPSKIAA